MRESHIIRVKVHSHCTWVLVNVFFIGRFFSLILSVLENQSFGLLIYLSSPAEGLETDRVNINLRFLVFFYDELHSCI
jgi:hypothetical protein